MAVSKEALLRYWEASGLVKNKKVLKAFEKVPRENFVLPKYKEYAYLDEPLPLFAGQTISQPTTVAIMTEALDVKAGQKILEVGSGSGYQAAILAELVGPKGKVWTVERIKALADFAKKNLICYKNVKVIHADGTKGLPKVAPFDRIIITAAAAELPKTLFAQLKEKGIMVLPIEDRLFKIIKLKDGPKFEDLGPFVFVPLLTGLE
ncbi:MAG: protein-L-isoaspartate(D-aspartate) O-methyltransferase [Candidatus Nanoarchaeia archaeon]